MKIEQLSNADRQMILEKYHQFEDDRPLTDEVLKELGFGFITYTSNKHTYKIWTLKNASSHHDIVSLEILDAGNNGYMFIFNEGYTSFYTTVGKLKMLIEALKGDNHEQ